MSAAPTQSSDLHFAVQTVRENFGFTRLSALRYVTFTGPDAISFLQNRLTNDVKALAVGQGHLNAALDRQGKIQGIFGLYRAKDGLFLLIDAAEAENTVAQIEKFHILEQYKAQDESDSVAVFTVQGPQSSAFLQRHQTGELPTQPHAWIATRLFDCEVRLINRSLSGETGFLMLVPATQAEAFATELAVQAKAMQAVSLTEDALEILRVETGLPRYGVDYDFETLLPETGLERDAVSYTKGCYLGQETIARVKTYGTVQKALVGLRFEPGVPVPSGPQDCLMAGKKVGELTRAIESPTLQQPIGMAYLGKAERVPGKTLTLQIGESHYTAQVTLLPFYSTVGQQDGATLLQEGLRLFSEGYEEAAIAQLRQALAVQPDSLEAAEALGVILSRQDQYPEAIALMEQILAQDPHHVLAHTNLSVFYMKLGDKEKAEEEKAKATMAAFSQRAKAAGLTFDPEAERLKKEAAALDKIAMFEEALKFSPADPLGNFGLGSSLLELKRYEEAIEPFRKTIQAQPKQSVAYLSLAKCLEGAEQPDEARTVLETGIAVAAAKGDLMPLKEMQARLESLTP